MRVRDLIKELEKYDEDSLVFIYADHGQNTEMVCWCEEQWFDGEFTIEEEDIENYNPDDLIKIVEICS